MVRSFVDLVALKMILFHGRQQYFKVYITDRARRHTLHIFVFLHVHANSAHTQFNSGSLRLPAHFIAVFKLAFFLLRRVLANSTIVTNINVRFDQ